MVQPIIKHNKLILTIFDKTRNHKCMTTNPFAALDKLKPTINLNEAYDKELKAINERRMMINGWKNELKKIQKQRSKKKYNGRD